ncbi:MAG: hypothetical protein JWQ35_1609, partial [Bacteriovoracaceae bacterium]|nr:hypothetical protein [Bacteriovoracaceae bacterium]
LNVKRALAGDVNKAVVPTYQDVSYVFESPRGTSAASYDTMTKIEQKGAKEITVCFSRIDLVENSDWIEVMGADYRVKDTMTGTYDDTNYKDEQHDLCAAPILGDTVYVRLSKQGVSDGMQGFKTKLLKVVQNETAK